MKPDQSIQAQLLNREGQPLPLSDVLVEIHFFTHGNFRYAFGLGSTDEMGRVTASYSDLEKQRRANSEYNVMDYNTKLDDCDPTVKLIVLPEQELRERNEKARRYFDAPLPWAKNWPSNAQVRAQEKSVELTGQVTRVEIPTEPGGTPSKP